MNDFPNIATIHEVLIRALEEDPDLQVKSLIATQLAQRNSLPITQKLMALSRSPHPEVREIVAASLEGHIEVFNSMLDWFEVEKDSATIDKLFLTVSSTLQKISDEIDLKWTVKRLKNLIEKRYQLIKSLELLGYCNIPISEEIFESLLYKYRYNDKIRAAILRGISHFAWKSQTLPEKLLTHIISIVGASFESPELREIGLDALGEIGNKKVIDVLELIIETDRHPALRRKAIEIIGKQGLVELSPLLIERLRYDGISDVRRSAAIALGKTASFEALPILSETLETDPSFIVREASAEALGLLRSQQALVSLLKGLEDHDSYVRATSAWSIEQLQPNHELIQRICGAARSIRQELRIRRGMVALLGRMTSNPEVAKCLLIIFNEDLSLRELVIEVLENFVPILKVDNDFLENNLPFILETLAISESFSLRAAICSFLGHLQESSTYPFLIDRLLNDEDAFVQRQAAWAISNLKSTINKSNISAILQDKNHQNLVPLFLEILTEWADLSDLHLALSYLKSDLDVEWRQRAVEFIIAIIDSTDLILDHDLSYSVIKNLILVLQEDKANTVRASAAHALSHFHSTEFDLVITPALLKAIKTERIYSVRELAAEALGFRGGLSAVPELIDLIQHDLEKDPSIRYFSSLALLNIETQVAKKHMKEEHKA